MASTLNSVPAANSNSGSNVSNSSHASSRPSLRSSGNSKGDGRRQSGSPVDGGQRYVLKNNRSTLCSILSPFLPVLCQLATIISSSWDSFDPRTHGLIQHCLGCPQPASLSRCCRCLPRPDGLTHSSVRASCLSVGAISLKLTTFLPSSAKPIPSLFERQLTFPI